MSGHVTLANATVVLGYVSSGVACGLMWNTENKSAKFWFVFWLLLSVLLVVFL